MYEIGKAIPTNPWRNPI